MVPAVHQHPAVGAVGGADDVPGDAGVGDVGPRQELQGHQQPLVCGAVAHRGEGRRGLLDAAGQVADRDQVATADGVGQRVQLLLLCP